MLVYVYLFHFRMLLSPYHITRFLLSSVNGVGMVSFQGFGRKIVSQVNIHFLLALLIEQPSVYIVLSAIKYVHCSQKGTITS